ncbi:MAG: A24 family peptidase [Nanoarchaeota archaeon]|nr:A24 family peptidase [Nanoarchaeota archaeon]
MLIIITIIVLIGLLIGSYTDLKTREVPDWLNFALVACGFGINAIYSAVYWDYTYILNSVAGFAAFFLFAILMYYTGQWGGGDSKMIMGLGALIGFDVMLRGVPFALGLLFNILIVGAAYGLFWSVVLVVRNWKRFAKEMKKLLTKYGTSRKIILLLAMLFLVGTFFGDFSFKVSSATLAISLLCVYYLFVSIKAIENVCMLKLVTPDKLTEGDWIAKDVKVMGERITGPKDLGISMKNIKKLRKLYKLGKVKKILIKEGIPFVPSFLIAFLVTLIFGNLVMLFL